LEVLLACTLLAFLFFVIIGLYFRIASLPGLFPAFILL
jgi:hypothetical protein